jgi:23S rRNA pseudouridine1911/1915/1917 synthase
MTEYSAHCQQLTVNSEPRRIDLWLAENLPDLSRSRIQKLIADGQVLVNEQICYRKKQLLNQGDSLIIRIPPAIPSPISPEQIPLEILYEDQHLIIINKPANLVVHPAPGHSSGTLVNALLAHCPNLAGIGGVERPGIVHRLDKDTTGAIVVAKTEQALRHLQQQIKVKTAQREYLGIVYGLPKEEQGTINLPIGRHQSDRQKMSIIPVEKGGRQAITHWQVQERLSNYSLLHFRLETGRTHQIRVHTAHMGHPLVGDELYSSGKSVGVKLTGQALHAFRLTITHPCTGEKIEAIAPLPLELEKLLRVLRQRTENQ